MNSAFQKILKFGWPYRAYAFLNIFFNSLYALFSALSFIALIPMLDVLFGKSQAQYKPPSYEGVFNLPEYIKGHFNYLIASRVDENPENTLLLVIGLVLSLFLLKNISNYFALFFITYLRNGIVRDLRTSIYHKIINLPISYFSKQKKSYQNV